MLVSFRNVENKKLFIYLFVAKKKLFIYLFICLFVAKVLKRWAANNAFKQIRDHNYNLWLQLFQAPRKILINKNLSQIV